MTQKARAVYEQGMLKLLDPVSLAEQQKVQVEITLVDEKAADTVSDPLAHIRIKTGIPDLAENFDDYRFGLKKP
jgi:predicted DNA-binding antitoxin AbrB/MazE fold protein